MTRVLAAVISIALVGAAVEPVLRAPADDGFPLSTYPMFASPRALTMTLSYAYGVAADGSRRDLSPDAIGSREVMQAFATLQAAVARGPWEALHLCTAIAERVRGGDLVEIRIVTGTLDAIDYMATGAHGPETEHARCEVAR